MTALLVLWVEEEATMGIGYSRSRELRLERALATAHTEPADLQLWPDWLTDERSLLVANPHFVFERIELQPGSSWSLQATTQTWILIVAGGATAGTFPVATGDALFVEADRVEQRAGVDGVNALVAYMGAGGPVVELLQHLAVGLSMAVQDPSPPELSPFLAQSRLSPAYRGPRP